jgi:hypothetical protein
MKIPVGTSWEVPNGVETEVYVDIVLMYDLVDSVGNSFIAVLSICDVDKESTRSSEWCDLLASRVCQYQIAAQLAEDGDPIRVEVDVTSFRRCRMNQVSDY